MGEADATRAVETVWRIESARLIAGLARIVGDVGFAEDLAQDALVAAIETWPRSGVPDNPGAWLMATARNRAIDELRRGKTYERKQEEMAHEIGIPELRDDLQHGAGIAQGFAQSLELTALRESARHRLAPFVDVDATHAHSDRARGERLLELALHRHDFVIGRAALVGVVAHDVHAQRAVAEQRCEVDAEIATPRVDPFGEGLPTPLDADIEEHLWELFDLAEHARHACPLIRTQRCERKRAVAGDNSADAVLDHRRRERIPTELRVEVRVNVDEAGRHDASGGVDHTVGVSIDTTDTDDVPIVHADVRAKWRQP